MAGVAGLGGGGITPFGGPYCIMGRNVEFVVGAAGGFGSLMANMTASMTCGSTVIVTVPILVMLSFAGLFGSSLTTPFLLTGFVQYFSNMPS